ncbi:type II toxin-antitoxin system VapC family toxin [Sphingomonas sp. H39-1-10]|uniref:type II toxin-antitoxin system VapC family toxin n=1 Tax=Sphingomonas pollutisoli TaxID=3030829 RepID=UPI0023B91FAA|nr:type II toxin-antitoxin system VapC family toxin [Sphingomonas pollutisoli]MDF0491627.1 type II toxin-antitoxin system VapC family toxin [Sphingomonas pollutisoli]
MIVLDTNVISEMMKAAPAPAVAGWLDAQRAETLYLSAITIAEIRFGIACLPEGKRRDALAGAFACTEDLFAGRVLAFDYAAARRYADLAASARSVGKGFPTPDGYIAAIAATHGYAVATRDVAPFEAGFIPVINPWEYGNG